MHEPIAETQRAPSRRRPTRFLLSLAVTLVALAAAPAAEAATVSVILVHHSEPRGGDWSVPTVTVQDAAGEPNDVTIARDGDRLLVHDAGAPILPGESCAPRDQHTVVCSRVSRLDDVAARLGAGDDRVRLDRSATQVELNAEGGAGDDTLGTPEVIARGRLVGGPGDDRLAGDRASGDYMFGGRGRDTLVAGRGQDFLDGGRGADSIDGGPHRDILSYAGRDEALHVDLARRVERSDGDTISGIEMVAGGGGPDTLTGTDQRDRLFGGRGSDTLLGGGGPDVLAGDGEADPAGDDTLHGGPGNDDLSGLGGDDRLTGGRGRDDLYGGVGANVLLGGPGADLLTPDRVGGRGNRRTRWDCGAGSDTVESERPVSILQPGCERITAHFIDIARVPGTARDVRLTHRLSDGKPCRVNVAVDGGAPIVQLRSLRPQRITLPGSSPRPRLTLSPGGGCDLFDRRVHVLVDV